MPRLPFRGSRPSPAVTGLALVALLLAAGCGGPFPQSTFRPASDYSSTLDGLFRTIFWWALGVFVVVESLLLYVVIRFRARPNQPRPKRVHGNTALELAWTLAPVVILVSIAVPTMRVIFATEADPPAGAVQVEVIGHQWWWEFRYPELGITTANEMHLQAGRPATVSITSADVIHSYWAPRLAGKRDAIAGRKTRLVFTPDSVGDFLGQCAEFCGASHANMRLTVFVDDSAGFADWVAGQQASAPRDTSALALQGEAEFRKVREPASNSCIACHTMQGISVGVLGPNLSHLGSRATIASGILPNTADGLARWLKDPPAEKPGSLMPNVGLTDAEIAALVAYLQSRK